MTGLFVFILIFRRLVFVNGSGGVYVKNNGKIFQFLLLAQTIIWIFVKIGLDVKLQTYLNDFHFYWVVSYALIMSFAIFDKYIALFAWLVQRISMRVNASKLFGLIRDLKPQDKYLLGRFVVDRKREVFLDSSDESTEWLVSNKIIIKTGSVVDKKDGYRLAVFVREYLIKNPNVLY